MKELLDALASNPAVFNSTVFFLIYDEEGGFFDHVPSPVPALGTPDEFVNGQPCGLGVRVPAIVVSPWSRGGYVCSEIFDHTSVLRFLEKWTGVQEPNISTWRRRVCGDLTSAFDFAHPNTNYPSLVSPAPITCTNGAGIYPTFPQVPSVQEAGTNLTRRRPYGPNAFAISDCSGSQVGVTMTNAGNASTHFMIFANAFRSDGPWQYDVDPHASLTAWFNVATSQGAYDFTCYGPHRFHRRFADNVNNNCDLLDVTLSVDTSNATVSVSMRNSGAEPVVFNLTNLFEIGSPRTYTVPAGSIATDTFSTTNDNGNGYSLTASVTGFSTFLRSFNGDSDAIAPPAGTNTIPITNHAPPVITNLPPNITNLTALVFGRYLVVAYPSGASGYALEFSTNLASNTWQPANVPLSTLGSNIYASFPLTNRFMFFRLRP